MTGQVKDTEVVMLGDSYMDLGNVGPTIMKLAGNKSYRHYYLLGAAMTTGQGDANIPFQYDGVGVAGGTGGSALLDNTVMNPKDIKVVIMDGGGNDLLVNKTSCLAVDPNSSNAAVPGCKMAVDAANTQGQKLYAEMKNNGVKTVVFYFYPHLDMTHTGGPLAGGAGPYGNAWLDYAKPSIETGGCGATFTADTTNYSCKGNALGLDFVFIDTTPAFVGHNVAADAANYWIQGDNIHPNAGGANAIATLVVNAMKKYCIAQ